MMTARKALWSADQGAGMRRAYITAHTTSNTTGRMAVGLEPIRGGGEWKPQKYSATRCAKIKVIPEWILNLKNREETEMIIKPERDLSPFMGGGGGKIKTKGKIARLAAQKIKV